MNPQINASDEPNRPGKPRPVVPRRTLLRAGLTGTATLAGVLLSPHVATAQPLAARPTAVPQRRAIRSRRGLQAVHAPDGAAIRLPLELGALIEARQLGLAAGSTLTLSWDDRLYRVASKVRLVRGQVNVLSQSARPTLERATHRATLSIVLTEALPAGSDYVLVAGTLAPARYPHDLVADPVPVTLSVQEPGVTAVATSRVGSDAEAVDGKPWGVSLGAAWQQATWGDRYAALYPSLVTFRSVGPGSVPARSSLEITLDPQVFTKVSVLGAFDSSGREVPGKSRSDRKVGKPTATWTSSESTPAGARITLRLDCASLTPAGALPALEPPLVSFTGPVGHDVPQRLTGQESLTRGDSIYSPATLKEFGAF